MKPRITLLANLEEGDKFYFAEENGKLKNTTPYYVEGQYPKFHCTTVCAKHNIKPCSSGNGLHMTMVTGVEDVQWVQIIQEHAIHTCHKVTPLQSQKGDYTITKKEYTNGQWESQTIGNFTTRQDAIRKIISIKEQILKTQQVEISDNFNQYNASFLVINPNTKRPQAQYTITKN